MIQEWGILKGARVISWHVINGSIAQIMVELELRDERHVTITMSPYLNQGSPQPNSIQVQAALNTNIEPPNMLQEIVRQGSVS